MAYDTKNKKDDKKKPADAWFNTVAVLTKLGKELPLSSRDVWGVPLYETSEHKLTQMMIEKAKENGGEYEITTKVLVKIPAKTDVSDEDLNDI